MNLRQKIQMRVQEEMYLSKNIYDYIHEYLLVDFSKAFDTRHRGKMEQILLVYGLPKETIAAIMMFYKNTKVKVCSPDRDRCLGHCPKSA